LHSGHALPVAAMGPLERHVQDFVSAFVTIWSKSGGHMCRTCFESFIRTGTAKSFVLTFGRKPLLEAKQDSVSLDAAVRGWIAEVWSESFVATSQAILKTSPFEFSAAGLPDLDQAATRENAISVILTAMEREGFTLEDNAGQNRALTVLFGFLNQVQQDAIGTRRQGLSLGRSARRRIPNAGLWVPVLCAGFGDRGVLGAYQAFC
jgi:hypothetical protein